jgi:hypothetical protein
MPSKTDMGLQEGTSRARRSFAKHASPVKTLVRRRSQLDKLMTLVLFDFSLRLINGFTP